jgi:hypothetical protein
MFTMLHVLFDCMVYVKAVKNELLECKWKLPWMGIKRCIWSFITLQVQPQVCLVCLFWGKNKKIRELVFKGMKTRSWLYVLFWFSMWKIWMIFWFGFLKIAGAIFLYIYLLSNYLQKTCCRYIINHTFILQIAIEITDSFCIEV